MIQRIQSVYLFVALALLWSPLLLSTPSGEVDQVLSIGKYASYAALFFFIISNVAIIMGFFLYKNLKKQMKVLKFSMLSLTLLTISIIVLIYYSAFKEEIEGFERWVEVLFLILSLTFVSLAMKAIQKDIHLIRSVDRIR